MNAPRQVFVVVAQRVGGRWTGVAVNQARLALPPSSSMDAFPSITRDAICAALHLDACNVEVLVSTTPAEIARWLAEDNVSPDLSEPGELRLFRRLRPDSRSEIAS